MSINWGPRPPASETLSDNKEYDLETLVLKLKAPVYHSDPDGYYYDVLREGQAPQIVKLLDILRKEGVDKTDFPLIAEYEGQRFSRDLVQEDAYSKALARAIVDLAEAIGMKVTVESTRWADIYGERQVSETLDNSDPPELTRPKFSLRISHEPDPADKEKLKHTITLIALRPKS